MKYNSHIFFISQFLDHCYMQQVRCIHKWLLVIVQLHLKDINYICMKLVARNETINLQTCICESPHPSLSTKYNNTKQKWNHISIYKQNVLYRKQEQEELSIAVLCLGKYGTLTKIKKFAATEKDKTKPHLIAAVTNCKCMLTRKTMEGMGPYLLVDTDRSVM